MTVSQKQLQKHALVMQAICLALHLVRGVRHAVRCAGLRYFTSSLALFSMLLLAATPPAIATNSPIKTTTASAAVAAPPVVATVPTPRWQSLADIIFQHYTPDQGLPHGVVTSIAQDKLGFIWAGTQGGLVRWDGYRFRTYLPQNNDVTSLSDNFVQALHTDQTGRLWVGTLNGGLARYEQERDQFTRIAIGDNGTSHSQINAMSDDGKGGIWVATNGGLDHLPANGAPPTHFKAQAGRVGALPDDVIRSLLLDSAGRLWVGTRKGLHLLQGQNFVPVPLPLNGDSGDKTGMPAIRSLLQSQDGRIWVGSIGYGAYVVSLDGNVSKIDEPAPEDLPNLTVPLAQENIATIIEVEPGQIWLATQGRGIVVVNGATMQISRIMRDPNVGTSLLSNSLFAMIRDRAGLLWCGTVRGLSVHDPRQKAFLTIYSATARRQQIPDSDAAMVSKMADNSIWLGLYNKGVNVIDAQAKNMVNLNFERNADYAIFKTGFVTTFSPIVDGNIYIGTGRGLFRYDMANRRLRKIAFGKIAANEAIRESLLIGTQLWIGSEDGLWRVDLSEKGNEQVEEITEFSRQNVSSIELAADGTLWVGTRNSGLFHFNPITHQNQQFAHNAKDKKSLSANHVSCLMLDRQGRLWIGTLGGGINVLQITAQGTELRQIGVDEGLHNPMIGKIMTAPDGNIWSSTAVGIVQIDPSSLKVREFGRADGVVIPSYWVNAGVVTDQEELVFSGIGGVTVVRPAMLKEWEFVPSVMISNLQVGGKQVNYGLFNQLQEKEVKAAAKTPVQIAADGNSITVEFSALDYSAPNLNHYAYKLVGYDKEWISTDASRRIAAYTNLPPGNYTLKMRGSNRVGQWSENERELPIVVLPAWHQTWWFVLLQVMIGALAILALVQARTKILRQRQQELATQVAERTLELQQNQEQLVAANHDLQNANSALNHANDALADANNDLALSVETLRQLGDIGRDITANLDAEIVFQALSLYVGGLLDAPFIAIYRINDVGNALELAFGREDDYILPLYSIALSNPVSNVARVARERCQQTLDFDPNVPSPSHIPGTRAMYSALYAPLIVDDKVLGVMSIQSARVRAYGERESLIFRTLSSYGAIALANAQALAALHQAQSQLVQQEKLASLGGLVAGIAHEINTPLGTTLMAISGVADQWQFLRAAIASGSVNKSMLETHTLEGVEYTAVAMRSAKRAADLINNFKSIAVHTQHEPALRLELSLYLDEITGLVRSTFEEMGCRIELDVPQGLAVQAIAEALTETLTRIFANVIDHAFCDGRQGTMQVSAHEVSTGLIEIVISDDGHGIAANHLPKVFDPFFTTKSGTLGHIGLGLHVAYNHVTQAMKGSIHIASTEGVGTTVTIRLPAAPTSR